MATDYLSKYADKENIKAFQEGGAAPAPAGGQPAGGQEVDPMQYVEAYMQAKQGGDENTACQAAMAFIEYFIAQMQQQQQGAQGVPAKMVGGKLCFDKNGNIV